MLLSGSRSDADAGVTACAGPFGLHAGLMSATGSTKASRTVLEAARSVYQKMYSFE